MCEECPYMQQGFSCFDVEADALDLINRQKAEIEISKTKSFKQQLKKELHRLTVEEIKAEAIKDFAERLTHTLVINNEENTEIFDFSYTLETIDNLVEEMIGEQ
jgi:hypothetical protein